jgi:hypothetical protein
MLYDRDVSDDIRVYADSAVVIALRRANGMAVLIGNTGDQTIHTPVTIRDNVDAASRFAVRIYNSERGDWEDGGTVRLSDIHGIGISVDAGGFRLVELSLVES